MKKILGLSLLAIMVLSTWALAAEKSEEVVFTGSATLTTNVLFRGTQRSTGTSATTTNESAQTGIASVTTTYKEFHLDVNAYDETDVTLGYGRETKDYTYDAGFNLFIYKDGNAKNDLEAYVTVTKEVKEMAEFAVSFYQGITGVDTSILEVSATKDYEDIAEVTFTYGNSLDDADGSNGTSYASYVAISASRPLEKMKDWTLGLDIQQSLAANNPDMLYGISISTEF